MCICKRMSVCKESDINLHCVYHGSVTFPPDGVAPYTVRIKLCPGGGLETAAQSEVGQRIAATRQANGGQIACATLLRLFLRQNGTGCRGNGRPAKRIAVRTAARLPLLPILHRACAQIPETGRTVWEQAHQDMRNAKGSSRKEATAQKVGIPYAAGGPRQGPLHSLRTRRCGKRWNCAASGMSGGGNTSPAAADEEGTGSSRGG